MTSEQLRSLGLLVISLFFIIAIRALLSGRVKVFYGDKEKGTAYAWKTELLQQVSLGKAIGLLLMMHVLLIQALVLVDLSDLSLMAMLLLAIVPVLLYGTMVYFTVRRDQCLSSGVDNLLLAIKDKEDPDVVLQRLIFLEMSSKTTLSRSEFIEELSRFRRTDVIGKMFNQRKAVRLSEKDVDMSIDILLHQEGETPMSVLQKSDEWSADIKNKLLKRVVVS